MTDDMVAITRRVTGSEADDIVAAAAEGWASDARYQLFYPYYWCRLRYMPRTPLWRSHRDVSCLVDARRGLASTTDPFELENVPAKQGDVLAPCIVEEEGLRRARRYATYVVQRSRGGLLNLNEIAVEQQLVYKPFWIVEGTARPAQRLRVIVDGMTGGLQVLPRD